MQSKSQTPGWVGFAFIAAGCMFVGGCFLQEYRPAVFVESDIVTIVPPNEPPREVLSEERWAYPRNRTNEQAGKYLMIGGAVLGFAMVFVAGAIDQKTKGNKP